MFTRGMFGIIWVPYSNYSIACENKYCHSALGGGAAPCPQAPIPFFYSSPTLHTCNTLLCMLCVFSMYLDIFLYACVSFFLSPFLYTQATLYNIYIYRNNIYIYTTWYIVILFTYNIIYTSFFLIPWGYFWSQNIFWSLALCIWSYTSSIKYQ